MADRVLVIDLLGGIGDLLLALPAVHGLARRHGEVHVVTYAPGADLLTSDPLVRSVVVAPRGDEAGCVGSTLARLRPDLVVSTTRHGGIPELVAATGCRAVLDLWRQPPDDQPVGDRFVEILRREGLLDHGGSGRVRLRAAELRAGARLVTERLGSDRRLVVVVPSAGMRVKEWPRARWTALAGRLRGHGVTVAQCAEGGAAAVPGTVALPSGSLREVGSWFAEVGRRGGVVVGADTGPMRLAAAAGAATVALFGPTARARYGLAGTDPRGARTGTDLQGLPDCPHRIPSAFAEQVCWWDADCPLSAASPACMADIDVPAVERAVLATLDRRG